MCSKNLKKLMRKLKSLEDSNSILRKEVNVLKQDKMEADLVFSGIPLLKEEDAAKIVIAVCKILNIDVKGSICNAFRLPGKYHPIIATFNSQHLKQRIYNAKRQHGEIIGNDLGITSGSNAGKKIIISLNIISEYYHLLQEARKLRQHEYKFIWYKNHAVHVRKDEQSKIHKISSIDDINKLIIAIEGKKT